MSKLKQVLAEGHEDNEGSGMLEALAEVFHDAWWHWAEAVMTEVSAERQERWKEEFVPYSQLDEKTKDMDREWAEEAIEALEPHLEKPKVAKEMVTKVGGSKFPTLQKLLTHTDLKKVLAEDTATHSYPLQEIYEALTPMDSAIQELQSVQIPELRHIGDGLASLLQKIRESNHLKKPGA